MPAQVLNLTRAIRATSTSRIAFTGAGGKTTALFQLARELALKHHTVIVTCTTHLSILQASAGDTHFRVDADFDMASFTSAVPQGLLVFTSAKEENGRVGGLDFEQLQQLKKIADNHSIAMLIEADGSRRMPLKAPARHEPVVPEFVDTVVVTAGLSGIGKKLVANVIHRPEWFAKLSGLAEGQIVTAEAVGAVLSHPDGGLKGIPAGARRIALLNQADTDHLQAVGNRIATQILGSFESIIVAALEEPGGVHSVRSRIAAIILAAGGSRRMGEAKQLLDWRGKPLIVHAVEKAFSAGCSPLVVVTGAGGEAVAAALLGLPVTIVHNPHWREGQSTSVQAGLHALKSEIGGALFMLVDQPFVEVSLIRALLAGHAQTAAPIVAPLIDEQRGNPVLFDRETFSDFDDLVGDVGGRPIFAKYAAVWIPWHDPRALLDIDTFADYDQLSEL